MTEPSVEGEGDEVKKPVKEVPVVQEQGFFVHDTGDTYDGFFEAKKKDRSVKMHENFDKPTKQALRLLNYKGPGQYTTAEGDVYVGTWDADRLGANEEITIAFTDGSRYEGLFKDWSYQGRGRYIYPDSSVLHGDFVENSPVGLLMLLDCNGHRWLGRAEQGYGWLEPVNHFYEMLEKTRESKLKRRSKILKDLKGVSQSPV